MTKLSLSPKRMLGGEEETLPLNILDGSQGKIDVHHFSDTNSNYVKETGKQMASIVIPESSDENGVDEEDEGTDFSKAINIVF